VVGGQDQRAGNSAAKRPAAPPEPTEVLPVGRVPSEVPADIRDVSFPTVVRGYDRREVDAYVERVNRVIAELEISRSPQAAVKHALDRVGEQTTGVLQRAREVAEELTATALAEAEHATRRAKVEAEEVLEKAQMQAHRLRGQSKEEADEIVARARAEAAESVERAAEQARTLEEGAERRLRALQADIRASADTRRKALDELRRTAAELDVFATGAINRSELGDPRELRPEPPTETIPAKTEPRAADGVRVDGDAGVSTKASKLADPAAASRQPATADSNRSSRARGSRRKPEVDS
jgi:DivIVA domain-containing protein